MNPAIVIPSYWAGQDTDPLSPGRYDHTTAMGDSAPELETCLASLKQVRGVMRVIVLAVCPKDATERVRATIEQIASAYPELPVTIVTNREAAAVQDRIARIAPDVSGEPVSLRGYGAIRNMGLAVAAILGHDVAVFLDDDEVVLNEDFLVQAVHGLNQLTRQGLPILAKTGYFYDRSGSPFADTSHARWCDRWWTKRLKFNEWMRHALATTRISRSNYVCGGCMALHARAYTRVAFDPYITRGEDLDYLFNLRMNGLDMWFDNEWVVKHLPPVQRFVAPRFQQNVYRWVYERAKIAYANDQVDLHQITPASLAPYPGPWISSELDGKIARTALARAVATKEHRRYLRVLLRGRGEARRYARENCRSYLRFQNFWPTIMNALWGDSKLASILESGMDAFLAAQAPEVEIPPAVTKPVEESPAAALIPEPVAPAADEPAPVDASAIDPEDAAAAASEALVALAVSDAFRDHEENQNTDERVRAPREA